MKPLYKKVGVVFIVLMALVLLWLWISKVAYFDSGMMIEP